MSAAIENEVSLLRELVATLRTENALLRQKIDLLARKIFGSSSEQLNPGQLELLLQMAAAPAPAEEKTLPAKQRPIIFTETGESERHGQTVKSIPLIGSKNASGMTK